MPRLSAAPLLTEAQLRAALLHRQLLLQRAPVGTPITDVLDRMGSLQDQYAPSGYVGLWTRLDGFRREELTRALEDRSVVQATLLRVTIHLASAREFWRYAKGVRAAHRAWWLRLQKGAVTEAEVAEKAGWLREALADGPHDVKELGPKAAGFIGNQGLWVDLVRVPPSGTWERRRADRLALAEQWVGPPDSTEHEGRRFLVSAYLRAFGPAAWADIASWAGVPVRSLQDAAADLALVPYRDERGRALIDLPGLELPDADTPAPVRFLPHWDALLLAHARRTQVLPEPIRPKVFSDRNPFSVGCILVRGQVAGAWGYKDGHLNVELVLDIDPTDRDELEAERLRLEAFHQ
ncbi:MAG: winged helix DNA-binding domain-containing protein [Chloroflexota bacterium]